MTPRCAHFGSCGGCDLQHVAYAEQLRLKHQWLGECLAGLAPASAIRPCEPSPVAWEFRHKVHFVLGEHDGRLRLGHYARQSRSFVPVDECPAHASTGNALAALLVESLAASGLRAYPAGPLRHVVVRVSSGGDTHAVTLVVSDDRHPRLRGALARFTGDAGPRVALTLNVNPSAGPYLFGDRSRRLAGPARVVERIGPIEYLLSPTTFFQTNVRAAERLVELVLEAVPAGRHLRVVDLYAGVGLFALQLAARGHDVVAIEDHEPAVADGLASLRRSRPPGRCRFVRAPVGHVSAWRRAVPAAVDVLVLDPPRQGCGPALARRLAAALSPDRIVYVSCDPEALARDLGALVARPGGDTAGQRRAAYGVRVVRPLDMFPHTLHLEAVVVLDRGGVDANRPTADNVVSRRRRHAAKGSPEASAVIRARSRHRACS